MITKDRSVVAAGTVLLIAAVSGWSQDAFGTWKINAARSRFETTRNVKTILLRIEPHAKGEVVTLDRILSNGAAVTTSIILSMDGQPREFRGEECSGTQSAKRLDDRTIEVRFRCQNGRSVRIVRSVSQDLILEIADQPRQGSHVDWRLVFNKQ